jgi:predicted metal-dependent hydrolase
MPVAADPFPRRIEVRPGRRRSVQLSLEDGRFVARVPARAAGPKLDATLGELRRQLWARLRRESVWTDDDLHDLAREVADAHLSDLDLPPWTTRFSRRQNKRWGSCTFDGREGRVRISAHLIGHPRWVIAQVLLHELIHLVVHDHGPCFQALMQRSPDHDRGRGYLEALESVERLGPHIVSSSVLEEDPPEQASLFAAD